MKCPVCGLILAPPATLCACGYDVTTGDPTQAIAKLDRAKGEAQWTISLGLAIAAMTPLSYILLGANMFAGAMAVIQLATGAVVLGSGTRALVRVRLQLRAATTLRQLPEARLLR